MLKTLSVTAVLLLTGYAIGQTTVKLSDKFQKRLESADSAYQTAVAKADNAKFYAVQKANADRVKVLKQAMTEATKAGDLDAANEIKGRLEAAEADGPIRSKPKNVVRFGSHEYAVVKDQLTWYQAKQRCQEMGGHLVTFGTPQEQSFILGLCQQSKVNAWLGASNDNHFQWTWVTGETAKVDPSWKLDDPQREHFSGALTYWQDTTGFNDHNLGAFIGFVCEWDE